MEIPVSSSDTVRRTELLFAVVAVALAGLVQLFAAHAQMGREPVGNQELIAAITIRALGTDGLQLDYPTPLLGHPWRIPGEFGLYYNLSALCARIANCPAETAGRAVSLALFYLGLPGVYWLGRQLGLNRAGGWLAVAYWMLSSFGRSQVGALGGTGLALTLAIWWLACFRSCLAAPGLRSGLAAAVTGAASAATDPFCFLPFFLVGLAFWWGESRPGARRGVLSAVAGGGLMPALAAAALWTRHTDLLKAANPYADFLQSGPTWAAAWGTTAQRSEVDFWISLGRQFFGALLAPLSGLLLLAFASRHRWRSHFALTVLAAAVVVPLVILLPLYRAQGPALGPACLFVALILAGLSGNLFRLDGVRPALGFVTGSVLLAAQGGLQPAPSSAAASPLPYVTDLAEAVARATDPGDLVVAAGQDWDPHFAYRTGRRTILVPAGRETDLGALDRAVGPTREWHVGAVVLTGRYRGETAYVAALRTRFALAEKPMLQTSSSDVYVPAAAEASARARVAGTPQASLLRVDAAPPPPPPVVPTKPAPVALKPGEDPFLMMSPRPSRYSVPYGLSAFRLNGETSFFAHAPTTLEFDLPSGGSHLEMKFFMAEGAYSGKGNTDGADVVASLRHRSGRAEEVFRRHLDPVNHPDDRAPQTATVDFKAERGAILVIQSLPGPESRANFDWVYFSRIAIK